MVNTYPQVVVTLVILNVVHLPVSRALHIAEPFVELLAVVHRSRKSEKGSIGKQEQVFPDLTTLGAERLDFIENHILYQ